MAVSRQVKKENRSLPVAVRDLKTSFAFRSMTVLLKLVAFFPFHSRRRRRNPSSQLACVLTAVNSY